MSEVPRATEKERELARRLLAVEVDGHASPGEQVGALGRALDRLDRVLGIVIGPAGYEALLRRALHLARAEYPFLTNVQVRTSADGERLPGLLESAREQDATVVHQGSVAILADLIWLLDTFVGETISSRLMYRAFPEVSSAPGSAQTEEKT